MTELKIGLIRTSLPSYFPERHKVWERAQTMLETLCNATGTGLHVVPDIPMDGEQTRHALDMCMQHDVDFVLCLHGGFTMGDVARAIAASRFRAGFWSVPEPVRAKDIQLNNFVSLNMSMSIARTVRDLRTHPVSWYHGAPESQPLQARIGTTLKALGALKALEGARIGVIGGVAKTFYNMEVSTSRLHRRFGVDVAHHGFEELAALLADVPEAHVEAEAHAMRSAASVCGVSDQHMTLSAKVALALREMASRGQYAALAVSDWPLFQERLSIHPGAAFSWLEEKDNLPVASEGDVLGAITQLLARSLAGRTGALLDMTEPDLESGRLLMWHGGGGPLHLARGGKACWINHPMLGRGQPDAPQFGAIADYTFAPGPVTIARVARNGDALFEMSARVVAQDPSGFSGIRGWLEKFSIRGEDADLEDVVATVMAHGIEHHFILVPGDWSAVLAELAGWAGLAPLKIRRHTNYLDPGGFS